MKIKNINFGFEEAKAEIDIDNGNYVRQVYFEEANLFHQVESGKILVVGNKGTGKSALATLSEAWKKEKHFCSTILKFNASDMTLLINDLNSRFGNREDCRSKSKLMWEWIYLINFARMIYDSNYFDDDKQLKKIFKYFFDTNMGNCDIASQSLSSSLIKTGYTLDIGPIANFLRLNRNQHQETSQNRPTIFELIAPLKNRLAEYINSSASGHSLKFFIFIDDLDENYSGLDSEREGVLGLINAAIDLFGFFKKKNLNVYPIVLARPDMLRDLEGMTTLAQRFSDTYGYFIEWNNYGDRRNSETSLLRKIISNRIRYSHHNKNLSDYWSEIFDEQTFEGDSFKTLLDHTRHRPRDLISLMKAMQKLCSEKKFTHFDFRSALPAFTNKIISEWRTELQLTLAQDEIFLILESIKMCPRPCTFLVFCDAFNEAATKNNFPMYHDSIINDFLQKMYHAGMVANKSDESTLIAFNYRMEYFNMEFSVEKDIYFHKLFFTSFVNPITYRQANECYAKRMRLIS